MPKGVPRTHNHWIAISYGHLRGAGIRRGERLLNPFPLINMAAIGGCFMSWLHSAGTLVLHHPLDLGVYLRQIAEERPDYAIAPPAVLNMLLKDEKLLATVDLSSLRCIGSGSAPLDPEMIRGYQERFGIEIVNSFGSNEGMALMSNAENAANPEHRARLFPRYGRDEIRWESPPHAQIRTRVVEPETGTEILEAGKPGELQITGPTVFDGYFRAPQITAESFTADGWFRTGDLFEITGDDQPPRYYRFIGRLKQIIVRGGVKIAPEELDSVLSQMPDVLEGAVTAYRDEIMGERICAVVVPKPGKQPTLDAVRAHFAAAGLALFKHPERLQVVEQLPRNSVGKVVRGDLTRMLPPTPAESTPAELRRYHAQGFHAHRAEGHAADRTAARVQAARDPHRPALTCDDLTLTRAELTARVHRRARALQAAGVEEGDFVAIALPNGTAFLEVAFACWTLGATPAPVSHRLPPLELQALLEVLQPRLVVGGEAARASGVPIVTEQSLYDPALSADPLPERIAKHVKAIASGGSTGRPKVIVDHARSVLDPDVLSLGMRTGDTVVIPGPDVSLGTVRARLPGAVLGLSRRDHAALRCRRHPADDRAASRPVAVPGADDDASHLATRPRGASELRRLVARGRVPHRSRMPGVAQGKMDRVAGTRRASGKCIQAPRPSPRR